MKSGLSPIRQKITKTETFPCLLRAFTPLRNILLFGFVIPLAALSLAACDKKSPPSISLIVPQTYNRSISNVITPPEAAHIVRIGFIGPVTGPVAAEGTAARNAFQMAIDEANNSGRFPYIIETIVIDDQSSDSMAVAGVRRILQDPLLVAASGFWNSGPAAAAIPLFKEAKVPLLIWGAISESLTSEYNVPWITRSAPTDKQENIPLAKAVLDSMGYRDWFVVSDAGSYGAGNLEGFSRELSARGITPLGVELVREDAHNQPGSFDELVQKITSSGAKAVYCGSTSGIASALKRRLHEAGVTDILFCGISGIKTDEFFGIGQAAAEGTLVVSPGIIPEESAPGRRFMELYNSKGFSEPIGAYTPYAYEAALILLNSLSVCSARPTPAEAAGSIFRSRTAGIMGATSFNEIGQTVNVAAYLNVAQNGAWVPFQNSLYSTGRRSFGGR